MSYGSVAGVEAIVPALGTLDSSSTPTSTQVTAWLAEGYAKINAALSAAGYSIPVSAADALPLLRSLENLYGAAYALRARGMEISHDEEELRSETYLRDFRNQLLDLTKQDLTALGVTLRPASNPAQRRRRLRSLQIRRIDGYSAAYGQTSTTPLDADEEAD